MYTYDVIIYMYVYFLYAHRTYNISSNFSRNFVFQTLDNNENENVKSDLARSKRLAGHNLSRVVRVRFFPAGPAVGLCA